MEQTVEREQQAKITGTNRDDSAARTPVKRKARKIYPNDPCPCGSGKKFKQCHGRQVFESIAKGQKPTQEMLQQAAEAAMNAKGNA